MEPDKEEYKFIYTVPGSGNFPVPELAAMPVKQFLSYLDYRECEREANFPSEAAFVRNPRNGAVVNVPIGHYMIQRELIYLICLELGVNMPDEFQQYQRMMSNPPSNQAF